MVVEGVEEEELGTASKSHGSEARLGRVLAGKRARTFASVSAQLGRSERIERQGRPAWWRWHRRIGRSMGTSMGRGWSGARVGRLA